MRPTSSIISAARRRRCALSTPRISSPYATFSITCRCGSSPKCWNTMANVSRRSARRAFWSASSTSAPRNRICPAVGSISRVRQRMSVDLPEPERPMTTNTSPGATSKLTSRTAATHPVARVSSAPSRAVYSRDAATSRARGPNTFHRLRTEITGSSARVPSATRPFVAAAGRTGDGMLTGGPADLDVAALTGSDGSTSSRWRSASGADDRVVKADRSSTPTTTPRGPRVQ